VKILSKTLPLRDIETGSIKDRSFPAFAGTAVLLPGNWGVSVGTNLVIVQGDHKDRPYPTYFTRGVAEGCVGVSG